MIVFRNTGLIDLLAVTTMGVSVKEPGSFGYFGTGLKYALATILRDGGEVFLFRGPRVHKITTGKSDIRGESFNIVKLDGRRLGFTDQLGKNWEPWMVLRELGCNANDELDGCFYKVEDDFDIGAGVGEDETVFAVRWEPLEQAYRERSKLFAEGEVLYESPELRIRAGRSENFFYRGVRAYKLEHASAFTYDILAEQRLTEDRTLGSPYNADAIIREEILCRVTNAELLAGLLCPEVTGSYEARIKYSDDYSQPSKEFLDTVMEARERKDRTINESARSILSKHIRKSSDDYVSFSGSSGGYMRRKDRLSLAVEALEDLHVDVTCHTVVMVDELPSTEGGDVRVHLLENERIYVTHEFVRLPIREIAAVMLDYHLRLECPWDSADATRALVVPLLLNTHPDLVERAQVGEDDDVPEPPPTMSEPEAIIRQDFLGEQL